MDAALVFANFSNALPVGIAIPISWTWTWTIVFVFLVVVVILFVIAYEGRDQISVLFQEGSIPSYIGWHIAAWTLLTIAIACFNYTYRHMKDRAIILFGSTALLLIGGLVYFHALRTSTPGRVNALFFLPVLLAWFMSGICGIFWIGGTLDNAYTIRERKQKAKELDGVKETMREENIKSTIVGTVSMIAAVLGSIGLLFVVHYSK